jgi:hypothetical protein
MQANSPLSRFLSLVQSNRLAEHIVKIQFSGYKGALPNLKQVIGKIVKIKDELHFSFVYRNKTNDITKNVSIAAGFLLIEQWLKNVEFTNCTLQTLNAITSIQFNGKRWHLKEVPSSSQQPLYEHNHVKQYKIKSAPFLHALGLANASGEILPKAQDKYRQINHYIEILSSLFKQQSKSTTLNIADMGSGKGYLTFALYHYLKNELQLNPLITGVEYRKELVDFCNELAQKVGFEALSFVKDSIIEFKPQERINVLIALHACDTATDDAIALGIAQQSELIVVAPCCHKQVRKAIVESDSEKALHPMLKHGIFMERQAEMLTDSIRALILELNGYQVKVFEFVTTVHTPKNIMIVAEKKALLSNDVFANKTEELANLKRVFGLSSHYLEDILKTE